MTLLFSNNGIGKQVYFWMKELTRIAPIVKLEMM